MTDFKARLAGLMDEKRESASDLARALGVPRQSVSLWTRTGALPRPAMLARLAEHYAVSPAWLQYGGAPGSYGDSLVMEDGTISIPRYDLTASCGGGEPSESMPALISMVSVSSDWLALYAPGASKRTLNILPVRGDSMSPVLEDGDIVIVDSSQKRIRDDAIYALQYCDGLYIKRVQTHLDHIEIISENPAYSPMKVSRDDLSRITVLGRAYAVLRSRKL